MKKLFLITCALLFVFSCEKDTINNDITTESEVLQNRNPFSSCTIINVDPFVTEVSTFAFGCFNYPNDCFDDELKILLREEILDQAYPNNGGRNSDFITNGNIHLELNQVINTNNIDPFISADNANIVYDELACQIIDHINTLIPLGLNEGYIITITSLHTDFEFCCGPQAAFTDVSYKVWKVY
jgi:hypothetical protein